MQAPLPPHSLGSAPRVWAVLTATALVACTLETEGTSMANEPPARDAAARESSDEGNDTDPDEPTGRRDAGTRDARTMDAAEQPGTDPELDDEPDETLEVPDAAAGGSEASDPSAAHAEAGLAGDASILLPPGTDCSLEGTFAAEVDFAVEWNATTLAGVVPLLKMGSGHIPILVRFEMRGGPQRARSVVTVCRAGMPEFEASNALIGTESYSPYFPDRTWDDPTMPRWDLGWEFACMEPGCALETEPLLVTLGARMAGPDVWPGRTGPIEQIMPVDHDSDGRPGIAIYSRGPDEQNAAGVPYSELPVTWTLAQRATKVDVALQLEVQFKGTWDSCDTMSADIIGGRVESRALGCMARRELSSTETRCDETQRKFVDENIPTWGVTGGSARVRRIAPGASCEQVRAAWPSL